MAVPGRWCTDPAASVSHELVTRIVGSPASVAPSCSVSPGGRAWPDDGRSVEASGAGGTETGAPRGPRETVRGADPVWCNKAAESSLVAGRSAAHGPCREPHPSPVSGGRRAAPLSHRQRRSLSVGIVGWPGTSDHVGPVGLHRPPRPCDAQDPGGGGSEPVLRGDRRHVVTVDTCPSAAAIPPCASRIPNALADSRMRHRCVAPDVCPTRSRG